ncbi:peptidase M, neutral zinc metallopeptidase site [Nostoc sp. MS1]|uniref:peptidase M, neutral zinc metallopeptidase site n=1 Tax=Nostoc sp. MS1 TaxID=2764711 RepID=UPI001CC7D1C0|nr:peptidase M, neutral zinc metallopeptidase site [Nostoc sp. MS1]BCL33639.1 hypothetical protein NSMS1_00860 [Nostoc sp. MS1]
MNLLHQLNQLSKKLLGIGIIDAWQQAPQTKAASQKATQLAQKKHLREAVTVAEKTLSLWSRKPSFCERWICRLLLGNLINQLTGQLQDWRKQIATVDKLAANAKILLKQDTGDPWETQGLTNVITIYQRCSKIIYDAAMVEEINQCQQELQKRQQFQELVQQAQSQAGNLFFQEAIASYQQAQQLYSTQAVTQAITAAKAQIPQEQAYYSNLQRSQQAAKEGKLRGAIATLETALAKFPRSDGRELLDKLRSLLQGREFFRQGLAAEKVNNFQQAICLYENAKSLLPDNTNCRIRLGLVTIKTQDWQTALSYLQDLPGEQAAYLRGFAYAKLENLQLAYREWQGLSSVEISQQLEILKQLSQRQRLLSLQNIEQLVKTENWQQAKTSSTEYIQKFGSHPLVEENLKHHIQPRLEATFWQSHDWQLISEQAKQEWLTKPDIITLHNWAVANYYYAQKETNKIPDLIISLSTALANIHNDISLQDVPWLGNQPVDFKLVFNQVKHRLESLIDTFKDKNIEHYLKYRDLWRLEAAALDLMGQPAQGGSKIHEIFCTPGCYKHYLTFAQPNHSRKIDYSQKILHCLYTTWGLAVAACIAGDSQRAIKLKPATNPSADLEIFASKFVAYHEGCYYLQQQKWREAIKPLKQAKSEIETNQEWRQEIDRLCSLQRQNISEDKEHLTFAQAWYDILESRNSRTYLAEYKAEEIREELANHQISRQQALKKLEKIKLIDDENPIVLDLIERIEVTLAGEVIDGLLNNNRFQEAVNYAQQTGKQKVKDILADIFIDILIQGFKTRKLGFTEIYELGGWAYELSPQNQNVQGFYTISQELHNIYHFIKSDRYDEAVYRAKYSQYDAVSAYVGDYLMMILLNGMQNQSLPVHVADQLGHWVYELCPDDPDYQEIYRRLNIL